MTNTDAAFVISEYIRTAQPCNGLLLALEKAVTALQHQPEPQRVPIEQQCLSCGRMDVSPIRSTCDACGSSDLRPVYVSEIGRKA